MSARVERQPEIGARRWAFLIAACGVLATVGDAQPQDLSNFFDCDAVVAESLTFEQFQRILDGTLDVRPLAAPDGRIKICLCERVRIVNPEHSRHGAIRVNRNDIEIVGIHGAPNRIVNRRQFNSQGIELANSGIIVEGRSGFVLRNVSVETTGALAIGLWLRDGATADLIERFRFSGHGNCPIGIRLDESTLRELRDFTIEAPSGGNAQGILIRYSELGEMADGYVFTSGSTAQAINLTFSEIGCMRRCVVEAMESQSGTQVHALALAASSVGVIDDCVLTTRSLDGASLNVSFAIKMCTNPNSTCVIDAILDSFVAAMGTQAVYAPPPNVIGDTEGTTFIDFWDGQ